MKHGVRMPITSKQQEQRKKFLGSSDAAAIAGLDPYRSPTDVYFDKTNQILVSGKEPNNDAIEVGKWCEDAVLRWFQEKKGFSIIRNQFRVHENGIMAANLDALVQDDATQAIEAKTTGVISRYVDEQWGQIETNEVPERVSLQCQHQMAVVPTLQVVWVPVLMGGVGLRYYKIERDEKIIADLTLIEENFWNWHVKTLQPPQELPSIETLKRMIRVPNKTVELDSFIVTKWLQAKEVLKIAEKEKQEYEQKLLNSLGDAECGTSSEGILTYLLRDRKAYTVEASQYRQLQFKKKKEGK